MAVCFDEHDLEHLSNDSLEAFEKEVSKIPHDLCAPFYDAAGRLDSQLLLLYKTAVRCATKDDDLDRITVLWTSMVKVCDEFATHLEGLIKQHPYCGADFYRDRFLDLRNTCKRLQELHS